MGRLHDTVKHLKQNIYRSETVNSNTVISYFHFIPFLIISCLKCTSNSYFHLVRSKTLPTNNLELTVSDLYTKFPDFQMAYVMPFRAMVCRVNGSSNYGNTVTHVRLQKGFSVQFTPSNTI